jgi:hypothetical protein
MSSTIALLGLLALMFLLVHRALAACQPKINNLDKTSHRQSQTVTRANHTQEEGVRSL